MMILNRYIDNHFKINNLCHFNTDPRFSQSLVNVRCKYVTTSDLIVEDILSAAYFFLQVETRMLRPSPSDDVFLVCNAFLSSDSVGWAEGSLELVELVMRYFRFNCFN